jgi:hypothetical protein
MLHAATCGASQRQGKGSPDMDKEARLAGTTAGRAPEALRLWLRLLTCTQLIETQVRTGCATSSRPRLPRFDLMAQLERAPDGLKMNELSRRMMVTGGNITGITDQLVGEGAGRTGARARRPARLPRAPHAQGPQAIRRDGPCT